MSPGTRSSFVVLVFPDVSEIHSALIFKSLWIKYQSRHRLDCNEWSASRSGLFESEGNHSYILGKRVDGNQEGTCLGGVHEGTCNRQ